MGKPLKSGYNSHYVVVTPRGDPVYAPRVVDTFSEIVRVISPAPVPLSLALPLSPPALCPAFRFTAPLSHQK